MISIAAVSFREAIRKRVIHLIFILTVIYIILYSVLSYYVMKELNKFSTDKFELFSQFSPLITLLGLYFSSTIIVFLTVMASTGTISSELESGIIHSIISKPLKRTNYILGKYLGLGILLVLYSIFMYFMDLLIPYFMGMPSIDILGMTTVFKGFILYAFEPLVVLSLCIFGNVFFKTLSNGIFVISIYIIGTIGGFLEQIGNSIGSKSISNWGIVSSLISPFDVIYRKMIATLFSNIGLSPQFLGPMFMDGSVPSKWMMLYSFILAVGLLLIAIRKFNAKDIF